MHKTLINEIKQSLDEIQTNSSIYRVERMDIFELLTKIIERYGEIKLSRDGKTASNVTRFKLDLANGRCVSGSKEMLKIQIIELANTIKKH